MLTTTTTITTLFALKKQFFARNVTGRKQPKPMQYKENEPKINF